MLFLSTTFCRGLHFPVQNHLGKLLHRIATLSLPRGHWVQPSSLRLKGRRVRSPGEGSFLLVRFTFWRLLGDRGGKRRCACGALESLKLTRVCMSTSSEPNPWPSCYPSDSALICAYLALRPRLAKAISVFVILAGSSYPRTNPLTHICC